MTQPETIIGADTPPPPAPIAVPTDEAGILEMLIESGGNSTYLFHLKQALTAFRNGGESPDAEDGNGGS